MTRTLVVTNDFPPRRGGIETFVRQLCEELPSDQVVVHTSSTPGDREYDATLPFPVVRDPSRVLLPTPAVGRRVERTFHEFGCDRVLYGASAPLGLLAPRLTRAGAVHQRALTHGHEVWWASVPVTRQLIRRIGDSVDEMTYVSDYCRRRIQPALSPSAAARFVRLSPTVDTTRFYPGCGGAEVRTRLGIPAEALVVVCVGRLIRRKGQDSLVKWWRTIRREFPDARLVIVGDGPQRRRLERLIHWYGVGESVILTGSVPWEEVPAFMDAGDVFAMPTRSRLFGLEVEAFGIVYAEAAMLGLPIVRGGRGGEGEAVGDLQLNEPLRPTDAEARLLAQAPRNRSRPGSGARH